MYYFSSPLLYEHHIFAAPNAAYSSISPVLICMPSAYLHVLLDFWHWLLTLKIHLPFLWDRLYINLTYKLRTTNLKIRNLLLIYHIFKTICNSLLSKHATKLSLALFMFYLDGVSIFSEPTSASAFSRRV